MILKKAILLIILIITSPAVLEAQNVTFKASAPPSVALGEQFKVIYTMNTLDCTDFTPPSSLSENFDVMFGPSSSTSTSVIQGQRSVTTTYFCILVGKKEGTFTIEPATIKVGKVKLRSNNLIIKVLPQEQPVSAQNDDSKQSVSISDDSIFIRTIVSKRSVYEQEEILVTFKLYVAMSLYISDINFLQFPKFEGFLAQNLGPKTSQWIRENYNGCEYYTVELHQFRLYPQKSGKLTIGSTEAQVVGKIKKKSSGSKSSVDDFFDTYQNVTKEISSQPVTIDVKSLSAGKS